jgi:hypothetical protein
MAPRSALSASGGLSNVGVGLTPGPKTHISRSDEKGCHREVRDIRTLQIAAVDVSIHNFHQDHHLNRRNLFKRNRSFWPGGVSWRPEVFPFAPPRKPDRIEPTASEGDMSRAFVSSAMPVRTLVLRSVGSRAANRRDGARRGGGARGLQTRQAPLRLRFVPLASRRGAPQGCACAPSDRGARWRGAANGDAVEAKAGRSCPRQAQVWLTGMAAGSACARRRSRRLPQP